MGSYLDKPETTKKSALEESEHLICGSSSMQGWRINQEDAHNAILNFGKNIAFFAVYDGHGGSEVAEYCSMKLPDFLKELKLFKEGKFDEALIETFLGFDSVLLDPSVIEELKQLAKKNPDYDGDDSDTAEDEDNEEIFNLQMEATMPLNEVLEKYKGNIQKCFQILPKKKEPTAEAAGAGPSCSGSGSSSSAGVAGGSKSNTVTLDNEVSSTNNKQKESEQNDVPSSSSGSSSSQPAPDSTATIPNSTANASESVVCGSEKKEDSQKTMSKEGTECDSAISSSSTSQENGENKNDLPSSSSLVTKEKTINSASSSGGSGSGSGSASSGLESSSHNLKVASSDTEPDTSSDDENDKTYKESPKGPKPVDSDGDTTDEDVDDAEGDDEEAEDEEDDELSEEEEDDFLNNEFMDNMESGPGKASGCTAVVALLDIARREVIVANAGDSRCIICRAGKAVEMSFDHKPEDEIEFERIKKAGGRVTLDGRVNGGLNLSRAIGDHGYKMNTKLKPEEQMISALPDLKHHTLQPDDEFMVLACDGIWNYMSNDEVVGFVKQRLDAGKLSLSEICEELFHNCLAPNTVGDGTGCDNMTAIIIKFKPTIFDDEAGTVADGNCEVQKTSSGKRVHDEENEATPASQKKPKLEDDLTAASVVDTSTA